ncbi:MAG: glycosyl/glycerophosphate transferase, partial [Terrimesophilobacter sp.]
MISPPPHQALSIDAVTLTSGVSPALEFTGIGDVPDRVDLVGPRLRLTATLAKLDHGWRATMPLLASRWGGEDLAPPSGTYRLLICTGNDHGAARVGTTPEPHLVPGLFRIAFHANADGLVIEFAAPLTDDELGDEQQARLASRYRAIRPEPENAVFFESFYGRSATCNPLALDREIAKTRPDVVRYWGVADRSVAVPDGAISLV